MSLRRTLAAALLCALPFAHAFAAELGAGTTAETTARPADGTVAEAAAEAAVAPTVKWVLPWKAGTMLEYASEDLTTKDLGGRERTRSTSTATVRISEVSDEGFVQAWSWRDNNYVVEEGDKAEEAAVREFSAALQDIVLEVQLDADGTYQGLRNLDRITPRLREATLPMISAGMDEKLAAISDEAKREEARKAGQAQVEAILDRMLAPAVVEVMLARNIQWYNALAGIDIEPDQDYEAKLELPSPVGGPAIPVTIVFSLSVSRDDPDDMYVVFEQKIDRGNAGVALSAIVESLFGTKLPAGEDAPEMSIVDDGMFVVHRPTGVPEMFESTRTVKYGERSKVERYRLRLLNGVHEHAWKDEAEGADVAQGAEGAEDAQ
jgi:hypothetical protein